MEDGQQGKKMQKKMKSKTGFSVLFAIFLLVFDSCKQEKAVVGSNGMVVSVDKFASQVGIDILKKGGNAVDAAVAVGFALAVTYPSAGNIGGGGFMTIYIAGTGKSTFIDFRETAPANAVPSMWPVDEKGEAIGDVKSQGGKSICIPGEVAGLVLALEKYGTFSSRG